MRSMDGSRSDRTPASQIVDARRSRPKAERQLAVSELEVTDVVRYGMGRGSRIDFTIGCAGHRVRLRLPAKHVLSYGRIAKSAIEEGLVLPYERSANRAWRKVLSRAMEHARVEPWLEGEEIANAIAAEIRELLDGCHRGDSAFDLLAGKALKQGDQLLVSPKALVRAVRSRLVDDVLAQATIAEAAAAHLGMRELRPRFADARPRAWAFPLPLAATPDSCEAGDPGLDEGAASMPVEEREALGEAQRGARAAEANWIRSMDRRAGLTSSLPTEGCELDPLDREEKRYHAGPVHGRRVLGNISPIDDEMHAGSNGRRNNGRSHE